MPFQIYAWTASISSGFVAVLQKLTSKYSISNPWLMNFFFTLFILIFMIPLSLINHVGFPHMWNNIFWAAFFNELFWTLFLLSLYKLDVSTISPLFNLRSIFALFLGTIFLGEILGFQQFVLIALIIICGFFVTIDEKLKLTSFFKPSIGLIVVAMFALALKGFFINKAAVNDGFWEISLWQSFVSLLVLVSTIPLFIKDLAKTRAKQLIVLVGIASLQVIFELAATKAFSINLGISSLIISLPVSMIIAFLFSVFAPKLLEKHSIKVYLIRFVAAGLMVFASLHL